MTKLRTNQKKYSTPDNSLTIFIVLVMLAFIILLSSYVENSVKSTYKSPCYMEYLYLLW